MYQVVNESEAVVHRLQGRDWYYLVGPENSSMKEMVFGTAVFHPGETAGPHRHEKEEEVIYILSGEGEFLADGRCEPLRPGTTVFIAPGTEHEIRLTGDEPLRLVTVFAPPVRPGSYDRNPSS